MYHIGDKVWVIGSRHRYDGLLAILCTIKGIDDENPNFLLYDVDEPIGHYVPQDEVYKEKEQVIIALMECKFHLDKKDDEVFNVETTKVSMYCKEYPTLDKFREDRINFIIKTWQDAGMSDEQIKLDLLNEGHLWGIDLAEKKRDEEWFNLQDIATWVTLTNFFNRIPSFRK